MSRQIDLLIAKHVLGIDKGIERSEYFWDDIVEQFHPSTNMEHAMRVVEKFELFVIGKIPHRETYEITLIGSGNYECYSDSTIQLAICKAALKSVGIEFVKKPKHEELANN